MPKIGSCRGRLSFLPPDLAISPPPCGFDKPRSFYEERRGQSFALSVPFFSFCFILCSESKNPAEAGFSEKLKLTDKAASFNHTSGICGAGIVLCRRLYLTLYDR
ncbi:hypothetical protein [Raoultella terrigena]|uniref:hypothetical protein n=1 Tax=Raoultella terrigena TaxID=577 RepID=UPI001F36B7F8